MTTSEQTPGKKSSHTYSSRRALRAALLFQRGAITLNEAALSEHNSLDGDGLAKLSRAAASFAEQVGHIAHDLRKRTAA